MHTHTLPTHTSQRVPVALRKKAEPLMESETRQRHAFLLPQPPSSLVPLASILVSLFTVLSTFSEP